MGTLTNNLLKFSKNWESYLIACQHTQNNTTVYRNSKDHLVHKVFISELPNHFLTFINEKKYEVKSSLGQSNISGIPWLCIMHKQVTNSVTDRFYIAYLFSTTAKKVFLSIGIGATQFSRIFGESIKQCVPKINEARNIFKQTFDKFSPSKSYVSMDLLDASDKNFIRNDLNHSTKFKIAAYEAGCFFTKSYNLDINLNEKEIIDDLQKYITCYENIINDPISIELIDSLAVSISNPIYNENNSLDYEVPFYTQEEEKEKREKSSKKKSTTSKNIFRKKPSKKVGSAGEEYVYRYEVNKLIKIGREDLSEKIIKQYEDLTFFPGYDIQSFDKKGNKIFIEVKSTIGNDKEYFEISENEVNASKKLGNKYFIYHVVNALANPKITTIIKNPIHHINDKRILLEPWIYKMYF